MKKKKSNVLKKNISGWTLLLPTIIFFIYLIWRPILIGIGYSFFDLKGFTPTQFVGLKNYRDVLSDTNFTKTLANTVRYVFWSLIIGAPLPFICAVFINEMVHTKGLWKVSFYLPVVIPMIAVSMIWKMIYGEGDSGLLNMVLAKFGKDPIGVLTNKSSVIPAIIVSMTWNGFGGTVIMYLASLQSVRNELYEAARLDGATAWHRFRYVLFPHMRGILLLMIIRQIIGVFNVCEQPLAMTGGGPNGASLSLGLTNYLYAFKYGQYDKSLALGVVTFCMLVVFTFIYFAADKKLNEE